MNKSIYLLSPDNPEFPHPSRALSHPNGLLAMGGDLTTPTLIKAYQSGIFPWFNVDEPILWWSPDPRMVLRPEEVYVSRSMKRMMRQNRYNITFDAAFPSVIDACSEPRACQEGTWITDSMKQAYTQLFDAGYAHSVEAWNKQGDLVGGLYGVAIGGVFFGESMFSRESNTSKLAMISLCQKLQQRAYKLIDCQVPSQHLESLGGTLLPRREFLNQLNSYCRHPASDAHWK